MKPPPYDEMSEKALPGHTSFVGMPMQHNFWLYAIIDRVIKENPQIRSIVEIGTGCGAVSSVFGLWGVRLGIPVATIDREMRHVPKMLERLGVQYWQVEEFAPETLARIQAFVGDEPTWLFCDGGCKRREFREIGPLMPLGSIVSAHDLGVEFRHEVDAADLCAAGVFEPVYQEWWTELNVQLAIYRRVAAAPRQRAPLTITMATHDDYDGVFFTLQSLRVHHALPEGTEFVILDNNPESAHGKRLVGLCKDIPGVKLVPVTDRKSSFVKYDAFKHATGEIVLGLDCHVLLEPGFIEALMKWWGEHPQSCDLLTGPVVLTNLKNCHTHMEPAWRGHDFGCWGTDAKALSAGVPFEVPMQGMGCWSVRREAWGGINQDFTGFGAEEWYIAEKVRQWGGKVMCHPALRWVHRFGWPVRTFPLRLVDKVRNYYLGWMSIYKTMDHPRMREMTLHWSTQLSQEKLQSILDSIRV